MANNEAKRYFSTVIAALMIIALVLGSLVVSIVKDLPDDSYSELEVESVDDNIYVNPGGGLIPEAAPNVVPPTDPPTDG